NTLPAPKSYRPNRKEGDYAVANPLHSFHRLRPSHRTLLVQAQAFICLSLESVKREHHADSPRVT
ncbi:unnamed protein product, partial [Tilletia caries]